MIRTPKRRATLAVGAFVSVLAMSACGSGTDSASSGDSEWPDTLTLVSIPAEDSTSIATQNEVITTALEKELTEAAGHDVSIELQEVTSYAAAIEAVRAGQAQIAALGPFSYVVAKDGDAGVELLGVPSDSADDAGGYQSYGIVPKGSDITDLAGFAGKEVCFVDQTSTSGYLFPSAGLLDVGIDPETGVTPVMAGGHDASALSVADGTCDAGFAADAYVDDVLIDSGELKKGDLTVVWKSDTIPASPYVMSTQLSSDVQTELKQIFSEDLNKPALVSMGVCTSEDDCYLPEDVDYGFVSVTDDFYDGIRKVCEITESDSCVA